MTEDLNTCATKSQVFKSSGAKFPDNIGRILKDIHYPIRPARIRESWMSFGVPEIASKAPRDSGSVWRPCLATRAGPTRTLRLATCQVHRDAFGRIPVGGVALFILDGKIDLGRVRVTGMISSGCLSQTDGAFPFQGFRYIACPRASPLTPIQVIFASLAF